MPLSEEARKRKNDYNLKRNNKLTKLFAARLYNEEYKEICDYLKKKNINKKQFILWAYEELKKRSD